jgi:hypothetical protein
MTDSDSSARAAVDAIVARDNLHLATEDYERLVSLYAETEAQLAKMRAPEFRESEPLYVLSS